MQLSKALVGLLRQFISNNKSLTPADKEKAHSFFDEVEQMLGPGEYVMELTYADAMKYFRTHAPTHQKATQGVIMRENVPGGVHIIQIFLDAKDEIIPQINNDKKPYGRRFFTDCLDRELEEAFRGADMILIK